jgi:DNA polymerase/3'-5' exonuclease PolX
VDLITAQIIADDVLFRLEPACEPGYCVIAGSVRREAPEVKDIELVYIPRMVDESLDLFTTAPAPMTLRLFADLIKKGFWQLDTLVKRDGAKYKRFVHLASGIVVELFRAQPENWGLQLAIRTGPAVFNKILVDRMHGAMPVDMKMEGGFLWRRGLRVNTPTERGFFKELDLPWIEPPERTAGRLWEILRDRRASYSKDGNPPMSNTGPS